RLPPFRGSVRLRSVPGMHFCGSVITHYNTFICSLEHLQSAVGCLQTGGRYADSAESSDGCYVSHISPVTVGVPLRMTTSRAEMEPIFHFC
ncbi:MAG: hypothetical protein IKI93_05605, partial [Clostridia bacterium]|nr:hypothetical protein [Clostridia bacterium]